jgi:hypothetical protein
MGQKVEKLRNRISSFRKRERRVVGIDHRDDLRGYSIGKSGRLKQNKY